jgi:hypothetical protein
MNEELLLKLYNKYNLSQKGDFKTFVSDMQNLEVAEGFYNRFLAKDNKGTVEQFVNDIGVEYVPTPARVPKTQTQKLQDASSKLNQANANLNTATAKLRGADRVQPPSFDEYVPEDITKTPIQPQEDISYEQEPPKRAASPLGYSWGTPAEGAATIITPSRAEQIRSEQEPVTGKLDLESYQNLGQFKDYQKLEQKIADYEKASEEAETSITDVVVDFGKAVFGAMDPRTNFFDTYRQINDANKAKAEEAKKAADSAKANAYLSIPVEYFSPITFDEAYEVESYEATTKEEAVRKAFIKMQKHLNRLDEALSAHLQILPEGERNMAIDLINGKAIDLKKEPSLQLQKVASLIESYKTTKSQINANVKPYENYVKDVTRLIGTYKDKGLSGDEIKEKVVNYLETLKVASPGYETEKVQDIINIVQDETFVGGSIDQVPRSIMKTTVDKLIGSGEAFVKTAKSMFSPDAAFDLVADDKEKIQLERVESAISRAAMEPASKYSGSISEEVVKKGDITLVVSNDKVVDMRNADGSRIYFPTKEQEEIAKSFNPEVDKTEKDYRGMSILTNTSQVVFDMLPTIAVSALSGGTSTAVMLGTMLPVYGDYYNQALETTGDPKKSAIYAGLTSFAIGYFEQKFGNLEARLGRTLSGAEKRGLYDAVTKTAAEVADSGIESYVKGPGFLKRVQNTLNKSTEIGKDVIKEVATEILNFPIEAAAGQISGVKTEVPTGEEVQETVILTTFASMFMSGANVALNAKNDINELIAFAAQRPEKFNQVADQWINSAPNEEIKNKRKADIEAKKLALEEVQDTFSYIQENNFDSKSKDKLTKLTLDKARALHKLNTSTSQKTKAVLQKEINDINVQMAAITPSAEPEVTPTPTQAEVVTAKAEEPKAKTFIGRDLTGGKKVYTDFDNTLYNPRSKELTAPGKELRAKLNSGELTPEDVEILTARSADEAEVVRRLFPELTITSGLSPEGKAAKIREAGGNSIFIDDNKENLQAANIGEVIDAKTVVPQVPKEVEAEKIAAKAEEEAFPVQKAAPAAAITPTAPAITVTPTAPAEGLTKEQQADLDKINKRAERIQRTLQEDTAVQEDGDEPLLPPAERQRLETELQTLNQRKDAIQKQSTTEIPIQPRAEGGQRLGGQVQARPEVTTGKGEEGKAEAPATAEEVGEVKAPAKPAEETTEERVARNDAAVIEENKDKLEPGSALVYYSGMYFIDNGFGEIRTVNGAKADAPTAKKIKKDGRYLGEQKETVLENVTLSNSSGGKIAPRTYTKVGNDWQYTEKGKPKTVKNAALIGQLNSLAESTTSPALEAEPTVATEPTGVEVEEDSIPFKEEPIPSEEERFSRLTEMSKQEVEEQRLSDNVTYKKGKISNAEDVDAAVAEYQAAVKELEDFRDSVKQGEDKARASENVSWLIDREIKAAEKGNYPRRELFDRDPRLAAIAEAKEMIEFLKTPEYLETVKEKGYAKKNQTPEEYIKESIERTEQDVKDLENSIKDNPTPIFDKKRDTKNQIPLKRVDGSKRALNRDGDIIQDGAFYKLPFGVTLFKGKTGKRNPDGTLKTAHPNVKGKFYTMDKGIADEYAREGGAQAMVKIPAGATIEVVNVDQKQSPEKIREAETEAINNSTADVVKLVTMDGKGVEVQYIINPKKTTKDANEKRSPEKIPVGKTIKAKSSRKEQQLEIINATNPAPNTTNTWVRSVEDINTPEEAFKTAFEEGNMYPDFTTEDMQKVLDSGEVTVYSSQPIKEGTFVTPSKMNAQDYAGGKGKKIYSKKVKAEDVAWIDQGEGQYAPVEEVKPTAGAKETSTTTEKAGETKRPRIPTKPKSEIDAALKDAEQKLKESAKEFLKAFAIGDNKIGIIFDPKAAAISRATAAKNFFGAIVDYVKAKVAAGKYDASMFLSDVKAGKFGDITIDNNGVEYIFDEVLDPGKNREQVKVVEQLRQEIENLYEQFENDSANLDQFEQRVQDIFTDLAKQQKNTRGTNFFFSPSDVKNLLKKASKVATEEDLNEFNEMLESILEDKRIRKFKEKVDRNRSLAKKRVKALKTTDNDLKNAISFNSRDRSFQTEDAKNNYQDLNRFNSFLEAVNNPAIAKDKKFLEDKEYFAKKYRGQLEKAAAKRAIKKAEFDKDGNLIEDGEIITPYEKLPKKYKDEFNSRQMKFDEDGNLINDQGKIITPVAELSKKEKAELSKRRTAQNKLKRKAESQKGDAELKESLVEEAQELQKGSRPIHIDSTIQSLSDSFFSLSNSDLQSLSTSDLATLISGFKSLRDAGILQDTYEALLSKAKQEGVVNKSVSVLENSSGSFRKLLRDIITFATARGKSAQDLSERFIKNTPLRRVDAIFKGKDGTYFYDTFLNPLAIGFGKFTSFNSRLKTELRDLSKNVSQKDSLKLMLYAIDKQYKNNPDSDELNSIEEEIANAMANQDENYKVGDFKIVKEIYDELLAEMGGVFDYRKMDAATSGPLAIKPNERKLIEYIEKLNDSQVGKIMATASRTGRDTKIYKNYTPLDRVSSKTMGNIMRDFVEETIDADTYQLDSPVVPGNVNARVKNQNAIRNWNYVTSNYNSAKRTELDYEVRQRLKDFGNYTKALVESLDAKMNEAKENGNKVQQDQYKAYKDFVSAMRKVTKEVSRDNFVASFDELSDTERVLNFASELGYAATLASVPRSGTEVISNIWFAMTAYPIELLSGMNYMMSNRDFSGVNSDLDKFISLVPTTQSSRLLDHQGSLYRDQVRETKGFGATSGVRAASRILETYADRVSGFNNFLNSFGDKIIAKPMWFGSFENEFNRLKKKEGSNEKFDIKRFIADEQYRFENTNIIAEATKVADYNLAQGFSSFNPFESIADLNLHAKAGILETFKRFLQRFIRFEFQSAEDALSAMVGRGSMSRGKGLQLMIATAGRVTLYTMLARALGDWFDEALVQPAVNAVSKTFTGEDLLISPEGKEEDWEEKIKTSLLGSIISLTLARRLNGLQKVPINFGVEVLNASFGDDLGLRKTEAYEAYNNSLVFSQLKIPNIEGFGDEVLFSAFGRDFNKPIVKDMNIEKYLLRTMFAFSGPYNPLLTNTSDFILDTTRSLNKDLQFLEEINPYKFDAVTESLPWFAGANLFTTLVPVPAPRDIKRNLQNLKSAIQFGPEVNDPVYKKAMKEGATLKEQRDGLDKLTDIRKEQVEKMEDAYIEFLESDEWTTILEESKEKAGSSNKFTAKFLSSKGKYLPERTYYKRGDSWFYQEQDDEKQVRSEDLVYQLDNYSDKAAYRYAWERFMIEMHKKSFLYQVEPKEISVGEFEFVPRGYKGTKLEQKYGKIAPMQGTTRFTINRYFN